MAGELDFALKAVRDATDGKAADMLIKEGAMEPQLAKALVELIGILTNVASEVDAIRCHVGRTANPDWFFQEDFE